MTDALDGLQLGFLSCAVFASLMIIVALHGICCNKRRRLAAAAAVKDSSEETAVVDPDVDPCVDVYAITGQSQLPLPIDCHRKPILYEPSSSSPMTSKSTSKRQQKNRNESPLKQKTLPQNNQKPKISSAASVLATIDEHETMTGDGKKKKSRSSSNGDEADGVSGSATDAPPPPPALPPPPPRQREDEDPRQLTTDRSRSSAASRDSFLSTRTSNAYNTINTTKSYETIPSTDSGFPSSIYSRASDQYDWVIRSSDAESCSDERTSSQRRLRGRRPRWPTEEDEEEEEGQQTDGGVFDPRYDLLFPRYCETLVPSDDTYEALKKPDYPATISTTHPVTQSQQIELKNMIKADASPKRNTVSLG